MCPPAAPGEEAADTNELAIASLFLSIVWLFGSIAGIAGLGSLGLVIVFVVYSSGSTGPA